MRGARGLMRLGLGLLAALAAGTARAHQDVSVAQARFDTPAAPAVADGGVVAPYAFDQADASYTVRWRDGDTDPTGHFTFYYMDHAPDGPRAGLLGHLRRSARSGQSADAAGRRRPRGRGRRSRLLPRDVPRGSCWLVAINRDPPFQAYSLGDGPVRVAHGGEALPPAVIVLRPDGYGAFDRSYRAQWLAVGKPPSASRTPPAPSTIG